MFTRARDQFWQDLQELHSPVNPAGSLATSFAVGTLLSFIPLPVVDTILLGLVLARFKRLNRASIFIARLIWNDLLVFTLYGPGYKLGTALVMSVLGSDGDLPGLGIRAAPLFGFTTGIVVLSGGMTLAGYLAFLIGIKLYRAHFGCD
jgi:hypothetical protein